MCTLSPERSVSKWKLPRAETAGLTGFSGRQGGGESSERKEPEHFLTPLPLFPCRSACPVPAMFFTATLSTLLLLGVLPSTAREHRGHISVVLLGATGDLAKKYLWEGLFQLYLDEVSSGHTFMFYGGAQAELEQGQKLMFDRLKRLTCPSDVTPDRCAMLKDQFLRLTQYHQLKTAEGYATLSEEIATMLRQEDLEEAGRLFYFSVPPFAYAEIARHINSSCRPPPGAWLRVVLEKPFGRDLKSAQQLAEELRTFFQEEEMYRVDHYLGKQVSVLTGIWPERDFQKTRWEIKTCG
ncbi:UNVERIFIED_CONTAM: 6-phosphogluconolactonase [Gekko kuhli]